MVDVCDVDLLIEYVICDDWSIRISSTLIITVQLQIPNLSIWVTYLVRHNRYHLLKTIMIDKIEEKRKASRRKTF